MHEFIAKHQDKIAGTLSGFDRLVFRGHPRSIGTPQGMMSAGGTSFNPGGLISRLDLAIALVRALGLDAQAKALAGTDVTATFNGQTLVLADNGDIPLSLRGYAQIALDKQIVQAFFALEQGPFDSQPTLKARVKPDDPTTRAFLAFALDRFRQHFASGN